MVVSPIESRYKTEMNALFDEKARLDSWMEVEVALARAHAKLGDIPAQAADEIAAAAKKVELSRVNEIEAVAAVLGKDAVCAGFYSYGEISPFAPGMSCKLHNQTMTITTLAEV